MKYYNHKEVKNIGKGTNLIVLLTIINGEYIGLAQQDKSYKIKPKDILIEQYDFLVCYKVLGVNEEYLVPIGYSDEDEWVEQEEDYKHNLILNNNLKSDENEILRICRNMKKTYGEEVYWDNIAELIKEKFEDIEDIKDSAFSNLMMYKVVKRCYQEKFPIQEYRLHEIPYGDDRIWIMNFVHGQDFDDYHVKRLKNTKIRGIDFIVEKNGKAIPHSYNSKTHIQYPTANCQSAVWCSMDRIIFTYQGRVKK